MVNHNTFKPDESYAKQLDADDPLAPFRDRFHLIPGKVYMLANSLGLVPKSAEEAEVG